MANNRVLFAFNSFFLASYLFSSSYLGGIGSFKLSDATTASRAKKAAKNHDPLALLANSNAYSSQSHARELQGDSQKDNLTTAMMLLARAITQKFSIPTNNRYGGTGNRNAWRQNKNHAFNAGTGNDESNQIVQRVSRTESTSGKANVQEQMLQAMKDEVKSNLKDEENDFMLDNSYENEILEELTAAVIMMARIQPADENAESEPSYNLKAVSDVNASNKVYEQVNHVKRKTIIHTSDDDQIDSNIIFNDPYVENNGDTSEHDSIAHDEYHDIQMLAYNVQREAKNRKRLNKELKKQKELLQPELETFKDRVKTFES
ncbi:hypothetical protein Tco_0963106, partial [Tanacetum coccineum]